MSGLPRERALPWVLLLLLSGLQLLVTQAWPIKMRENWNDEGSVGEYFPATVEFALHTFNQQSQDWHAYRLVSILDSRKEQQYENIAFSMNLLLGRTMCGKFEDDIDNCLFLESPKLNNTLTCFFTVSSQPWITQFELLNKTCSEAIP
ncbi:PREDICTED: putative cystatin-9-like protein CST9LP1 [Propithecus coquereli]|uniref:putative cystatin-9-like protein CST9LP1 n=1 Tax=Propithecus coquereli TaxID=379532 RepID=UPI00063FD100|nr:PREDICTED: putative cystatin-9-like protein CST9LP1 [Propithecus coquereli]